MAYTRIHAIKTTVHKSIAYICNPDKTEGQLLVSSFACEPENARFVFQTALSKTRSSDKILAYHVIQSFAEGEVSAEEAHRIGIELADRLLQGNYSYVIATHNDRKHPHSHIIFCAADNEKHLKFNSRRKTVYQIRYISDEICKEYGLSVIEPRGKKGKSYEEWKAERAGRSWKTQIRDDIDEVITAAHSYKEFLVLIKGRGYTVKGEDSGENSLKYIYFKAPGQERFVRGSLKSLGKDYTREAIRRRIENRQAGFGNPDKKTSQHQQNILKRTNADRKLIDISGESFRNSPGLEHWANIRNFQIAAQSYSEAENIDGLRKMIEERKTEMNALRTELSAVNRQILKLKELKYYLEQYKENLPFYQKYKQAKDPDRYMRMFETQIILFDGARRKLSQMGIVPKMSLLNKVNSDLAELTSKQQGLSKRHNKASGEVRELERKLGNITDYLGLNKEETVPTQNQRADIKKRDEPE